MGGKGGSTQMTPVLDAAGQDYYNRYPDVAQAGMDPYQHDQQYGQNEGRTYGLAKPPPMPHFSFESTFRSIERDRQEAEAKQAEMLAQQKAEQERAQGTAELNTFFTNRVSAANRATADVNAQITEEASHASTRGIDYTISDQEKQERINNLFADYWSEADDAKFNELHQKWGTENTKWTLPVKRGTGSGSQGALPKGEQVGGPVRGGGTILTEDEEDKKDGTILGGN